MVIEYCFFCWKIIRMWNIFLLPKPFCDFLKQTRKIITHAAMDFLMPSLVAMGTSCSNAIDSTWRGLSVLNQGSIQGGISESSERKNKAHAIECFRAAPRGENEHGETTGMGKITDQKEFSVCLFFNLHHISRRSVNWHPSVMKENMFHNPGSRSRKTRLWNALGRFPSFIRGDGLPCIEWCDQSLNQPPVAPHILLREQLNDRRS